MDPIWMWIARIIRNLRILFHIGDKVGGDKYTQKAEGDINNYINGTSKPAINPISQNANLDRDYIRFTIKNNGCSVFKNIILDKNLNGSTGSSHIAQNGTTEICIPRTSEGYIAKNNIVLNGENVNGEKWQIVFYPAARMLGDLEKKEKGYSFDFSPPERWTTDTNKLS